MWRERQDRGVVVATYAHPPMNYYTDDALEQLDALLDAWSDPDVRVVVFAGDGGRFITHFDVEAIMRSQERPDAIVDAPRRSRRAQAVLRRIDQLAKPVIAALDGDAMGFGFELALAADFRVGQHGDHRYGLPEVRLGIIPAGSGTTRLTKLVGPARALDLILLGRVVAPGEALDLGLVHELADDAVHAAEDLAERLAALPPVALAMAKKVIRQGADLPMDAALDVELEGSFRAKQSPDAARRMRAYLDVPLEHRRGWLASDAVATSGEIDEELTA